ncbi:MAG: JAB-like toxin 1 domain-containing protein [Prevotella sp.]|nr:JAB-like toxin 1 domain-containing protein [Prevotella sp.]
MYCAGDPVNRIDPDGRKTFFLQKDGNIIENTSIWDKIKSFLGIGTDKLIGANNKLLASFPDGTINLSSNNGDVTKVEIKEDKYANKFSDAVMKDNDIEWARIKHGKEGKTSNTIQNNHNDRDVSSAVATLEKYSNNGETILLLDHSHPIPNDVQGTNMGGFAKLAVSPEDMSTVAKYKPNVNRVFNKKTGRIEYYNSKRVYHYEKWK